jgi:hypothetical protein
MSTDGEVVNALVCKTSIHGFKSHSVLQQNNLLATLQEPANRCIILRDLKRTSSSSRMSGGEQWRYGWRRAAVLGRLFVTIGNLNQ